jgi:hypothetical protein
MPERKAFLLRIDPGLWAELESWAADELRSVNGQIEYLLKQALAKRKGLASRPGGAEHKGPSDYKEGVGGSEIL